MFETIKSRLDFKKVYKSADSLANRYLVLYYLKRSDPDLSNRFGITVSKKVGNAVVRNKVKRRIRELIRLNESMMKTSYDIVFVSRVRAKDASFDEINDAFFSLLNKCGLITDELQ